MLVPVRAPDCMCFQTDIFNILFLTIYIIPILFFLWSVFYFGLQCNVSAESIYNQSGHCSLAGSSHQVINTCKGVMGAGRQPVRIPNVPQHLYKDTQGILIRTTWTSSEKVVNDSVLFPDSADNRETWQVNFSWKVMKTPICAGAVLIVLQRHLPFWFLLSMLLLLLLFFQGCRSQHFQPGPVDLVGN